MDLLENLGSSLSEHTTVLHLGDFSSSLQAISALDDSNQLE